MNTKVKISFYSAFTFTKTSDVVKIVADLTGLTSGNQGFHIHEFGDCSAQRFSGSMIRYGRNYLRFDFTGRNKAMSEN